MQQFETIQINSLTFSKKKSILAAHFELAGLMLFIPMKIATTVFKNVIAPRTDIANEIFIYKFRNKKLVSKKVFDIITDDPFFFYSITKKNKVQKIVIGGCPQNILNLLLSTGAEVYVNAMGNPDDIISGILAGKSDLIPLSEEKMILNNKIKYLSK